MWKEDARSANGIVQPSGLRIYLLGPLRIERDQEIIRLSRRKVEALLAYLLLHPDRQTRDHLATLFWGDSSDSQARHSLRTALAALRKEVAAALLLVDRDHVQLNPDYIVWTDLDELLALEDELATLNPAALPARLALWQGELLAGFYEEWLTNEREYYRARLLKLFLQVTQGLRAQSEYAAAIAVAQQILAVDPANEQAHQHLMFCYVAAGDRAAALRQYEQCERALLADLDAPPMPETTALYRWIKQQEGAETTHAARITNLPIPLTSFVGRTEQMTAIKRLLVTTSNKTRLLTLVGAGGSGKTRLAIQAATDLIDRFIDGVWWVELAALTDSAQVVQAVARALGITERANETVLQSLVDFLGDKALLLVIDNCEHLIEACAHLATELLNRCPHLQILTTSREALNVAGEILWQVPTLTLPDPQQVELTELLLQFECIRLFFERASAVQPSFRLTLENAPAVVEICTQLDGIPLAIELAAARVKVLPVEQIAARLTSALGARFALLTQGSRTVLPRQQTLRAAIDWSYNLLDEAERQLFQLIAVFRGGFTLAALEQLIAAGSAPSTIDHPPSTIDLLTQLVDKSLVIVEPQTGENRYRLLETLREYGVARYPSAAMLAQVQQRHAEYFLHLAEQAHLHWSDAQQSSWLVRLDTEYVNLRTALDFLTTQANSEPAMRLAVALYFYWDARGYFREGRDWLRRVLAKREAATLMTQARALNQAGFLAFRQSDYQEARANLVEAVRLFAQADSQFNMADSLQSLAAVDVMERNYSDAQQRLEQSLALCRALAHPPGIGRALLFLGNLAAEQEQLVAARVYHTQSLQVHQAIGDQISVAAGFSSLAKTERLLGNLAAARTNYEESLKLARTLGHKVMIGDSLQGLGEVAFDQKHYEQADAYFAEALRLFRELGDKSSMGITLLRMGKVAANRGQPRQAFSFLGQSLPIDQELGQHWSIISTLTTMAALLSDSAQHLEAAVRFGAAAEQLRQERGIAQSEEQQATLVRTAATLRQQLGEDVFNRLWQDGRTTPLAQLLREAMALIVV